MRLREEADLLMCPGERARPEIQNNHEKGKHDMWPMNGGFCTETFVYVNEQSTFDLDISGDEVEVKITGQHGGDCCLVLSWGAVERLTPLFQQAAQATPK